MEARLITRLKSKLTSTQCGTCHHWKSLSHVQNDPRGYCYKGTRPEARGRFSEGCNHIIVLSDQLVDENFPHYIPIIPLKAIDAKETVEPTLPPTKSN